MQQSKLILVVDDEPDIVTLIKSRLEMNSYAVETAYNGIEAVEKAKKTNPDMILLDLMMPVMDGYEAGKRIKEDPQTKDIPIILFTAAAAEDVSKKGMETIEAVDYVIKPFDEQALMFLLSRVAEVTKKRVDR